MTCKSCKGTGAITLLCSTVPCEDCTGGAGLPEKRGAYVYAYFDGAGRQVDVYEQCWLVKYRDNHAGEDKIIEIWHPLDHDKVGLTLMRLWLWNYVNTQLIEAEMVRKCSAG